MAYAALASLLQIAEKMLSSDPYSIPCRKRQIESLHQSVGSLLAFLENCPHNCSQTVKNLETKIRDAAYKAEDILESHIAEHFLQDSGIAEHENLAKMCKADQGWLEEIGEGDSGSTVQEEAETSACDAAADFESQDNAYDEDEGETSTYNMAVAFESHIAEHSLQDSGIDEHENLEKMCKALDKVIEEIVSIEEQLTIEDGRGLPEQKIPAFAGSSRPAPRRNKSMEGIEDALMTPILEQLDGGQSRLDIIPIVGMGGIGKTTLARTIFSNQLVVEKFDIRAWVTISQEYRVQDIVRGLLDEIGIYLNTKKDGTALNEEKPEELEKREKEQLYKRLYGRRYLIVLDDVWNTKAWDDIKMLFPDNNNRSRIMLTTRQVEVAAYANYLSTHHKMELLDKDMSWNLLSQALFGKEECPSELVEIGKEIAANCRGLPLSIVVIAGLLSKQNMTEEYWEYVAGNVNSVLTTDDEQCSEILSLSYNYLPHHLKACFLYMGIFPEDYQISVSKLIKLWVAEGFLKPDRSKSFEEVAEESLKELMDRNLILVLQHKPNGKPKICSIHDLLREICMREAKKEKFLCVLNRYIHFDPEEANEQRRLSVHPRVIKDDDFSSYFGTRSDGDGSDANSPNYSSSNSTTKNGVEVLLNVMQSMPLTRSFIAPESFIPESKIRFGSASFPSGSKFKFGSGLLRVLDFKQKSEDFPKEILKLVNLRCLALDDLWQLPFSLCRLRNLQTLIVSGLHGRYPYLPSGIWDMPHLRHLQIGGCYLPAAKARGKKPCVLKNLQTLSGVKNFICKREVLARIPNLRKLKITYDSWPSDWSTYALLNLFHLSQLETLSFLFDSVPNKTLLQNLKFPSSLKKLTLKGCQIPWEHMTIVGRLPNLECLKLQFQAFRGPMWEPNEEEFMQLKFLLIEKPVDLQEWRAESNHFPCLQHLILRKCKLEEIPSGIGDIATLEIIELHECSPLTETSAKEIQENCEIKVIVHPGNPDYESSSSGNYSSLAGSLSSSGSSSPVSSRISP